MLNLVMMIYYYIKLLYKLILKYLILQMKNLWYHQKLQILLRVSIYKD